MSDDEHQGQGTGAGDAGDDEQDRTSSQGDAGGTDDAQGAGSDTDTNDDDPRIKRANRDAARYRRELREEQTARAALEERLAALEGDKGKGNGSESSEEELRAERERNATTVAKLRRVSVRAEIAAQAAGMKLADVDTALALLRESDPELKALEWADDQPTPESITEALEDLLERKPFLIRADTPAGVARSGTGGTAGASGSGGTPPRETDDQRRARLRVETSGGVWDPENARRHGGGVVT